MTILVTSTNGRTGRPVVKALASQGVNVRAFIRDPGQEADLKQLGDSECAVGDLEAKGTLMEALDGCDKVVHIGPPMHSKEIEISEFVIDCAKAHGLDHFIYYSVMHPLRREVRHHRLKLDVEEKVIESGLPYTILQPCRYKQHLEPIWKRVCEDGIHAMPFDVTKKFNVVDLLDLADAVATVSSSSDHLYVTYELAGPESLSQEDMVKIISDEIGKEIEAKEISLDDLEQTGREKGLSEDRNKQMKIMNGHYSHHGFLGNPKVLEMVIGRPSKTFKQYVKRLSAKQ